MTPPHRIANFPFRSVRETATLISPLPSGGEGVGEGESHRENH